MFKNPLKWPEITSLWSKIISSVILYLLRLWLFPPVTYAVNYVKRYFDNERPLGGNNANKIYAHTHTYRHMHAHMLNLYYIHI